MSDQVHLLKKVRDSLFRIGTSNGTAFPESTLVFEGSNEDVTRCVSEEQAAYEYMLAREIEATAKKRAEGAKARLVELGMLDKAEKAKPGDTGYTYSGQLVSISYKVNNPAKRVDTKALSAALRKLGVSQDKIDQAFTEATKESKPAVILTTLMP